MKKLLLSLVAVVASCIYASADTSTLTLASGNLSGLTTSATKTVATPKGFKWTFSMTGGSLGNFDNSNGRGYQFGSSSKPISSLTITSEGFKDYNVSKVTLHTNSAKNGVASVSVSVGETLFLSGGSTSAAVPINTQGSSDIVFEGVAAGEVTISYNVTSAALYVLGIDVEYTLDSVKKQAHLSFPQNDYYVSLSKAESFEAPALDNPYNVEPITYSIDVEDDNIAMIDENTGDVVLGNTTVADITVTASFPGNDEYEADEQTYIIHLTEDEFATVTFDFENNDYGMTRFTGSGAGYNAANTKFGNEWVICTANEKTRLWWTGKEATETASGKSMRVYAGGQIKIETPVGTEITNISIFHYNENGDADDVTDAEDHEHVASIEGNTALLAADWTSSYHRLSAVEVMYKGKSEVMDAVVDAFKAGKHDNGDSHFTVKVNGVEQVSSTISFSSDEEEETQVELAHYYPHATIYAKFEPTPAPAAAPGLYYDAAEGFAEHTAPITLSGSGTLSYYAEMNGHTTPVQTVAVTDTNTTTIDEINAASNSAEVYDLQGRRVIAPARGLYIIGGKLQLK